MNEKFQFAECVLKFSSSLLVNAGVQVNPDNSRAMSALIFLLFKLNTLHKEIIKL